ncbi:thiopeptide-type bacteriocin biosynthesis protein [Catellatospora coxensis]|uniref:Lantibiotic biosynthesis protein n=1 Tax=Catellatospora coxensis TaxID=310354 RepID=A0A8J3P646_9ACTN|nr:thiopeptide-type bacteriocin biosynthesis protein [Catellatospora coxensis]GIG05104.1 lantibiotic biosynthesis protein [Catellatospora coxensis]
MSRHEFAAPVAAERGDWLAVHVFYASNNLPLLVDCMLPLVRQLQQRGLISGWFFIRYWMEGPHIRLRLRPATAAHEAEVRRQVEQEVQTFLRHRPALYHMDEELLGPLYKQMFLSEYTEQEWEDKYGDGGMPLRDNNSYAYLPYEPEYDKYAGPVGIEISEWHFERSSDMVMSLLETTNVHMRTVMFGLATQLMTAMTMTMLRDRESAAGFLDSYRDFWETAFQTPDPDRHARFDITYDEMAPRMIRRVGEICAAIDGQTPLTGFTGRWVAHCVELRERITAAAQAGELVFAARDGSGRVEVVTDPQAALRALLFSYVHMTNNRLGVSIVDEVYLSYLLHRVLAEAYAEAAR